MQYVNRKRDVYYVFQGVTKTGKPKYYVSLKPTSDAGQLIDSIPDGFELYEDPADARVSVRKKQLSEIHDSELQFIRDRVATSSPDLIARVGIKGRSLVIYDSPHMSPAFQFKLVDAKERVFEAHRFCFRGSVDDWISLHHTGKLDELCRRYLKHLGKESFFELM